MKDLIDPLALTLRKRKEIMSKCWDWIRGYEPEQEHPTLNEVKDMLLEKGWSGYKAEAENLFVYLHPDRKIRVILPIEDMEDKKIQASYVKTAHKTLNQF